MNNKAPHSPYAKSKLLKGGIDPMQRALSIQELDEQVLRDIESAEKHANSRIEASKRACEERRKRKESSVRISVSERLEQERNEARRAAEHYRNLYYLPKDGLAAAKNHPFPWENAKSAATASERDDHE